MNYATTIPFRSSFGHGFIRKLTFETNTSVYQCKHAFEVLFCCLRNMAFKLIENVHPYRANEDGKSFSEKQSKEKIWMKESKEKKIHPVLIHNRSNEKVENSCCYLGMYAGVSK